MKSLVLVGLLLALVGCATPVTLDQVDSAVPLAMQEPVGQADAGKAGAGKGGESTPKPAEAPAPLTEYWACTCSYSWSLHHVSSNGLACSETDPTAAVQKLFSDRPQASPDATPWVCTCARDAVGMDCSCALPPELKVVGPTKLCQLP